MSAARLGRLSPSEWTTRPAVIYLVVTTQILLVATIYFSLRSWNLLYPARPLRFVGLANYEHVFSDPVFRLAVGNTVLFTVVTALLSAAIGLGLAVLVNRLSFGRSLAYALLFAPFLIMETVNPIIWKNMILNPVYGLMNFALTGLGFAPVDLITNAPRAAILLMMTWQWAPFMMLVLLAGLQSVSQEVLVAAEMDGAKPWSQFLHVTLPHLIPYLSVGMLIESIHILPVFGPIYVGTYGGPGNQTANLMFAVYRILTEQYEIGRAAAGGIITAIMTSVVALAPLAYVRPYTERRQAMRSPPRQAGRAAFAFGIAFVFCFPILWTAFTGLKSEADAIAMRCLENTSTICSIRSSPYSARSLPPSPSGCRRHTSSPTFRVPRRTTFCSSRFRHASCRALR